MITVTRKISLVASLIVSGLVALSSASALATEPLPPGHPPIPNPPAFWPGSSLTGPAGADPRDFYLETLHPQIQQNCVACHRAGGTAEQSGARLVLSDSADESHEAFAGFLALDSVDPGWVLGKVTGQFNHGGGQVATEGSSLYQDLDQYLALLTGTSSTVSNEDFWRGTSAEPPEITLRRASLLFAGKVASAEAIAAAKQSEAGLREQILATMEGEGFHEFIITGAQDRLLTEGLVNGVDGGVPDAHYPVFDQLRRAVAQDWPENNNGDDECPMLVINDIDEDVNWSASREPAELIAHVIMTDKPYRQILTADYTMVNAVTDLVYRSGVGFANDCSQSRGYIEEGYYDKRELAAFEPGRNLGYILWDDEWTFETDTGIGSYSGYQDVPHSGVLTTKAWLSRYPSTDTNRNRARARWTYFHFLGVDIEKSAPRTTDPAALADTNNPTMHNPACTVCHESLDPVAGAYQTFGDGGDYLDQLGGMDSLSHAYKYPEEYGLDPDSTDYEWGDTWYRDMRAPGFNGEVAKGQRDSLQWLGYRVSRDPRFAAATVRFWWPAIFGADPLTAPEDPSGPNYEQRLTAFNAQDAVIQDLARKFEEAGFSAKSLFADMVLSNWYRHSLVDNPELVQARRVELSAIGRGRLLTPEELERKTKAVFGRIWGQERSKGAHPHPVFNKSRLTGSGADYRVFYGGMDGATVTTRKRELTPLMTNVVERMAAELACMATAEDFHRAQDARSIFQLVDRDTVPGLLLADISHLEEKAAQGERWDSKTLNHRLQTPGGTVKIRFRDETFDSRNSADGSPTKIRLIVDEVLIRRGTQLISRDTGEALSRKSTFMTGPRLVDENGTVRARGEVDEGGWSFHDRAWLSYEVHLNPGEYDLEVRVRYSLLDNNINNSIELSTTAFALENFDGTESAEVVMQQISRVLSDATSRQVNTEEVKRLMRVMTARAHDESWRGDYLVSDENFCWLDDVWRSDPDLSSRENWARHGDEFGMIRAWTAFVHGIMTSFGYLHD